MAGMLPLSDGIPARRFPIVNVALIAANFAVWIFYELPHLNSSIYHASFYPCTVNGSCNGPEPWWISWFTAMFMHGSWDHILGNMLFLAVFGKNVEDAFGTPPLSRLLRRRRLCRDARTGADDAGSSARRPAAHVPTLGASGAIAAVLGAYFVLYPRSTVLGAGRHLPGADLGLVLPRLLVPVPARRGELRPVLGPRNGGGVAFFAHVGGFVFGMLVTLALVNAGRLSSRSGAGVPTTT